MLFASAVYSDSCTERAFRVLAVLLLLLRLVLLVVVQLLLY